ncbi:MAG TPA: hypothetical protein VJK48_05130 [Chlamydiales bacterium]|nr:hypothetical protein [Chlamydiales bacterium]
MAVLFIHLIMIAFLVFSSSPFSLTKQPIAVRTQLHPKKTSTNTKSLDPNKEQKHLEPSTVKTKKPTTDTVEKSQQKKASSKQPSQPVVKKKSISKEENSAIAPELLEKLAKSVDQVLDSAPEEMKSASLFIPAILTSTNHTSLTAPYADAVMQFLKENLQLPEFGEVVINLEIESSGHIAKIEILQTGSLKNSDFLKKRLPELSFPCFNEFALSETKLQFTIAFRNAENHRS